MTGAVLLSAKFINKKSVYRLIMLITWELSKMLSKKRKAEYRGLACHRCHQQKVKCSRGAHLWFLHPLGAAITMAKFGNRKTLPKLYVVTKAMHICGARQKGHRLRNVSKATRVRSLRPATPRRSTRTTWT